MGQNPSHMSAATKTATTSRAAKPDATPHDPGPDSAEERLQYYASQFPLVEVDSTYYALPFPRMAELWRERTPPDFVFDVKAHALMTGQPTEVKRLPKFIRDELPEELREKS